MKTLALTLSFVPAVALAYQLKTDSTGHSVSWATTPTFVADPELGDALGDPNALSAVQAAVQTFATTLPGLGASVVVSGGGEIGYDPSPGAHNENDIIAVTDDWAFDSNAIAVTVLTVDAETHQILDTDIALNAAHHTFRVLPAGGQPGSDADDIQNTLTHELGHAFGLAHNPDDAAVVMYPSASKGETTKRTLADDDRAGLEALYPEAIAATPAGAPRGGCSAAGGGSALWVLLLALPFLFHRRSRKAAGLAAALVPLLALADPAPTAVMTAKVASVRTLPRKAGARLLFSEVTLTTESCLQGTCPAQLTIVVAGGREGRVEQTVVDAPVPRVGQLLGLSVRGELTGEPLRPGRVRVFRLQ